MLEQFIEYIPTIKKPAIDAIAVTEGPGLEPCLWTGINLAKALALVWDIPVGPVNHMEGHIFSSLLRRKDANNELGIMNTEKKMNLPLIQNSEFVLHLPRFPALALLISGGHTELVLLRDWFNYEIIGKTRDDAVGEAFDKVARILGLPYPGGPEISALAEKIRSTKHEIRNKSKIQNSKIKNGGIVLPRPMIHSSNFDFSFSGLKTAVLYLVKKSELEEQQKHPRSSAPLISEHLRMQIAREFEDAVTEVLVAKTKKAIEQYGIQTLLIGGGVIANTNIRRSFEDLSNNYGRSYLIKDDFLRVPEFGLTTDNGLMIAVAGFIRFVSRNGSKRVSLADFKAKGNLRLD